MIRPILCLVAIGLIFLGLWLIASAFNPPAPAPAATETVISAPPRRTTSPAIPGLALLAGGVCFLIMVFRKR